MKTCYNSGCLRCGAPVDRNFQLWIGKDDPTGSYCAVCEMTSTIYGPGIPMSYIEDMANHKN